MTAGPVRKAACSCGQLSLALDGEPRLVSACHCLACQRRTGSALGWVAFYPETQIIDRHGKASHFARVAESGATLTYDFCPNCGSTVSWTRDTQPGLLAVAVGAFADPNFPPPARLVWAESRQDWLELPGDLPRFERGPV